jgi:Zn-dependent metalloprotease
LTYRNGSAILIADHPQKNAWGLLPLKEIRMFRSRRLLQIISIIVILTIIFPGFPMQPASAQGKDGLKRQVNPQTGKVSFLGPESGRALSASQALGIASFARPADPAMALVKRFGSEFGLKNPERDLKEMKSHHTEAGRITARYQQHYQGVPVMGGELIVNTNDSGDLYSMNGEVSPDLSLSIQPTVDSEQARQTALQAIAKWYQRTSEDFLVSEPELWIYDESLLRPSTLPAELVWRMEVTPKDRGMPVRELVLINAQRGNISLHFNQIDNAWKMTKNAKVIQFVETSLSANTEFRSSVANNTISANILAATGATWYVTTTGSDANLCSSTASPCKTINGAIGKAAAGDTIKVATGTYTGNGGYVVYLNKSITLSGGWDINFTTQNSYSVIDGSNIRTGIRLCCNSVEVTVDHFTIQNGSMDRGGGVFVEFSTLTINNTTISNNSGNNSAGIYNDRGNITLYNSVVSNNQAFSGDGGGIANYFGTITLNNSSLTNNIATYGSGISNYGTLTLNNSTVSNNSSSSDGGGGIYIDFGRTATITNSQIVNNNAPRGGGVFNNGILYLNGSTVSGNISTGSIYVAVSGGNIHNSGTATIINAKIINGYSRQGGGLYNEGNITLNNTVIADNQAYNEGAGIYQKNGGLDMTNVTISNSTASSGGGGIYVFDGAVVINNSTITQNFVTGDSDLAIGGGLSNDFNKPVTIRNTIITGNAAQFGTDCQGQITSGGHNLIGYGDGCIMVPVTGDQIGTLGSPLNAKLGNLLDNGGGTLTHALLTGSPAINAGDPATCATTDQRGVARPQGAACDIGAFEGSAAQSVSAVIKTYTASNNTILPGAFLCDQTDINCTSGDSHAKAAHKYAIGTYNLYLSQHNRNGIDQNNMPIISSVHYSSGYANAFWSGSQMVYGDAYGFPLADDVVAHELTHGVTQYESNLFYYYQSGAINESFSDLWGEYYDQTNGLGTDTAGVKWQIGEDISDLGTIRNMSDPSAFGDPDKMSSANYDESEEDNGGVHHNSGLNNKAVFLMVDGGSFNGKTVTALGWTKTVAIYYEVNTNLLSSGTDYSDLYYALQQACSNLIGQKGITAGNCTEVKDAIDAVEMNSQPAPNFNTDAPYCDGNNAVLTTFSDDLEAGTGNWTFNNGSYKRWQVDSSDGPFAQSGLHSLYADDKPDVITDASARLKSIVVPNNAYLRFAQAYGFESGINFEDFNFYNYDGGVLEYSLNNGLTWVDAGSLINFNGYKGTIFTGAGNPLSGQSAFVGASHGYISTRLNLAALAGQTISFRWRMGLDEAAYAGGWWVDNIKIYTCTPLPPAAFNRTSPANGATSVGLSTTLSWGNSSGAAYYQYCYDIINDNQCNRSWSAPLNTTSADIANLGTNSIYYWQVRAVNAVGTTYANNQTWGSFTTTSTLPAGLGSIETFISTTKYGKYSLGSGKSLRESYSGANNGSVKIASPNAIPFIGAERVIYNVNSIPTSFSEMMALPDGQLDNMYWLPWYNNVDLDTQLRFGNVSETNATVHVWIGGVEKTSGCTSTPSNVPYPYVLAAGASLRVSCPGVNNGPVKIISDVNIVAAERVIYNVNGLPTSFSEMMGLPDSQLNTTYWMPWYNNVDLDTQLRFGNVSETNATATVHLYIGGQEMLSGCSPSNSPYTLAAGASLRVSCPGANNGPVRIVSDIPIVAAERVIYKVNNLPISFSEMMGLPDSQLDTTYWMPWYNNVDLDTQLRFGNVSDTPATVHMWIGGQEKTSGCAPSDIPYPYVLPAGASLRVSCPGVNNGPVKIISDVNIVAAERVIYKLNNLPTSFSEMMGLPNSQLNATYWMPWYNNIDLDTQLRFGVP